MPGPQSSKTNRTVPALQNPVSSGVGPIVTETCTVYCGKSGYLILGSRGQFNALNEKTGPNFDVLTFSIILKDDAFLDICININDFPY